MKKLILFCIILLGTLSSLQAQNAPLNKQQTLEYIEKLFKDSYSWGDYYIKSISLKGNTLEWYSTNSNEKHRVYISKLNYLIVEKQDRGACNFPYHPYFDISGDKGEYILGGIMLESDANRLKKALEHLIEILKTEKSTDPFGE
jgi:SNF2 family DNA or RNA helicase